MKKVLFGAALFAAMGVGSTAKAQLIDEANVTVTMELQPILQLNMSGPTTIDFVFDQIPKYIAGITHYGATTLSVSSTVNWDLYAVGYAMSGALTQWDQQVIYGINTDPNALDYISLNALELHQDKANNADLGGLLGKASDYSAAFVAAVSLGTNSIFASATPYTKPLTTDKFIEGHNLNTDFMTAGTYLILNGGFVGASSQFYYVMDYRIKPSLPAVFPNSSENLAADVWNGLQNAAGVTQSALTNYAQPGVYTMNVKYVLMEN